MATKHLKRAEIRERLGDMPERSFARLVAAGLPRKGDGSDARFPWPECFHWYLRYRENAVKRELERRAPAAPTGDDVDREKAARADIAEMKRDLMRGRLAEREAFEEELSAMAGRLSAAVRSLRSRHLREVVGLTTEVDAAKALGRIERLLLEELRGVADDDINQEEPEEPAA
jgi:phage terminase Nu1 subunit (DNA packaging protein)